MKQHVIIMVMLSLSLVLIGSLPAQAAVLADGQVSSSNLQADSNYWSSYLSDTESVISAPLRWDEKQWGQAGLFLIIDTGLYQSDAKIQQYVQDHRSNASDRLADLVRPFGDGRYTLPLLAGFYYYGVSQNNHQAINAALLGTESFFINGVLTEAIKLSGHRHRPSSGDPSDTWDGPRLSNENVSFPSGHTSSAFAVATVVATVYKDDKFVPVLAYSIATLTGWSRINDNQHWTSDVFAGAVLGYCTAKSVIGLHQPAAATSELTPIVGNDRLALVHTIKF